MSRYLHIVFPVFENALHPAAGKKAMVKKKKRSTAAPALPKGTPDSLNIRDIIKRQDSVRRNPAP